MLQMQALRAMRWLTPLALTLAFATILGTGVLRAASSDDKAVRRAVTEFAEALNRHDMDAFGALFAPDADFVNVVGLHSKGRQLIQLNHAFMYGTVPLDSAGVTEPKRIYGIFKASVLQFKQIYVRFLRKDVAVAHVQWELFGDARTKNPRRGLIVATLTEDGGRWLIAVAQNTEICGPPSAMPCSSSARPIHSPPGSNR